MKKADENLEMREMSQCDHSLYEYHPDHPDLRSSIYKTKYALIVLRRYLPTVAFGIAAFHHVETDHLTVQTRIYLGLRDRVNHDSTTVFVSRNFYT